MSEEGIRMGGHGGRLDHDAGNARDWLRVPWPKLRISCFWRQFWWSVKHPTGSIITGKAVDLRAEFNFEDTSWKVDNFVAAPSEVRGSSRREAKNETPNSTKPCRLKPQRGFGTHGIESVDLAAQRNERRGIVHTKCV